MLRNSPIVTLVILILGYAQISSAQLVINIDEQALTDKLSKSTGSFFMKLGNGCANTTLTPYITAKLQSTNQIKISPGILKITMKGKYWGGGTTKVVPINMPIIENIEQPLFIDSYLNWEQWDSSEYEFLVNENFDKLAWKAGDYIVDITTRVTSSSCQQQSYFKMGLNYLTIKVPEILTDLSTVNKFDFTIDNLSYFRSGVNKLGGTFSFRNTIPFTFQVTNTNPFALTNGFKNISHPRTGIDKLMLTLTPSGKTVGYDDINKDDINKKYVFDVEIGNQLQRDINLSISSNHLQSCFINSGDYKAALDATATSGSSTPITRRKTYEVNVHVADLGELLVAQSQVDFKFDNVAAYQNGVEVDLPAHLKVSKTTPYHITVKAENANFISGKDLIPVTVLGISPGNNQTEVNTISSITTQPQVLVKGEAVIDRDIAIKYKINKDKTTQLLNKKPGNYTANIIYTLTAQ